MTHGEKTKWGERPDDKKGGPMVEFENSISHWLEKKTPVTIVIKKNEDADYILKKWLYSFPDADLRIEVAEEEPKSKIWKKDGRTYIADYMFECWYPESKQGDREQKL